MGIHRGAFLRTTYVRLEGVSFAVGICMEACRDPEIGIHTGAFFGTTYLRLGRGVLAMGVCTEAFVEALTWVYKEGHF